MPRKYDDDPRGRRFRDDDDEDRPRRRSRRDDEDDEDRPRSRRKSRRDYDEESRGDYDDEDLRPGRRSRSRSKQINVVGMISIIIGSLAIVVALFMPCLASKSLIPAIIGLIVGFIGLVIAQKSDGRQGIGLPITGMSVSAVAVVIAVGWLIAGKQFNKVLERHEAEFQAEEEKRKADVAKAATDVKEAQPSAVIRVSAAQFYRAYDNDEDRADRIYKNKIIDVTGTIIEVDLLGDVCAVMLKGGFDEFETVDCHFANDPAIREQLAQLRPGSTVTIRGKCLGGFSDLEGCILIK